MTLHSQFKTVFLCSTLSFFALTGCESVSKTSSKVSSKALSMIGLGDKNKVPEIDKKGVVDISKTTLEQIEKLTQNMPTGQWVYIENDLQGIYNLQNKSKDGHMLLLRLNCKNPAQRPGFIIQNKEGQDILKAHDPQAGAIQFLVDNKNYSNPFDLVNIKKLDQFKTVLKTAKVIKIFNASKLYTFENGKSELLTKPVTCKE
ncbi:hypothetical protein [Acinetobacter shaoyimingii]|uniref:Uncharacterized protein n=1 Tax=Acinetobacter shaoyimingii TaxID=2715164 RepID=A0A6G8RZF8_9GAMM|nr:hypothetical protein [Acinetobacter shaoyimingii]NHB59313.1 hypothetical protein [Acinetobacter shaoyimingii]QIO07230.1 hypothetical protein G8E00_15460 [Acinetobacter shaoyimingii]